MNEYTKFYVKSYIADAAEVLGILWVAAMMPWGTLFIVAILDGNLWQTLLIGGGPFLVLKTIEWLARP